MPISIELEKTFKILRTSSVRASIFKAASNINTIRANYSTYELLIKSHNGINLPSMQTSLKKMNQYMLSQAYKPKYPREV